MNKPAAARGRTRNEDTRRAILDAAVDIVGSDGYAAVSMERIARESGAGKQTIYRWWPTKADVVMEALLRKVESRVAAPETGTLRGDLTEFLTSSVGLARTPGVTDLLRALAAEAQLDEAFADRFRAIFVDNRRAALTEILGRHEHDIAEGVGIGTLVDVVFGVVWYRILIRPTPFDDAVIGELVNLLAAGETR